METEIKSFLTQFNFEVGYWDGEELTCYRRRTSAQYRSPYNDNSLEPFGIEEYLEGSPTDLAWEQLGQELTERFTGQVLLVALNPDLIQQWKKEWG